MRPFISNVARYECFLKEQSPVLPEQLRCRESKLHQRDDKLSCTPPSSVNASFKRESRSTSVNAFGCMTVMLTGFDARRQVGITCLLRELHGEELALRPNVCIALLVKLCPLSSPACNRGSQVVRRTTTRSRDTSLLIQRRLSACFQ